MFAPIDGMEGLVLLEISEPKVRSCLKALPYVHFQMCMKCEIMLGVIPAEISGRDISWDLVGLWILENLIYKMR